MRRIIAAAGWLCTAFSVAPAADFADLSGADSWRQKSAVPDERLVILKIAEEVPLAGLSLMSKNSPGSTRAAPCRRAPQRTGDRKGYAKCDASGRG